MVGCALRCALRCALALSACCLWLVACCFGLSGSALPCGTPDFTLVSSNPPTFPDTPPKHTRELPRASRMSSSRSGARSVPCSRPRATRSCATPCPSRSPTPSPMTARPPTTPPTTTLEARVATVGAMTRPRRIAAPERRERWRAAAQSPRARRAWYASFERGTLGRNRPGHKGCVCALAALKREALWPCGLLLSKKSSTARRTAARTAWRCRRTRTTKTATSSTTTPRGAPTSPPRRAQPLLLLSRSNPPTEGGA